MPNTHGGLPERFYALAGRPLMQVRMPGGERAILALDPTTGAFLPHPALHHRLSEGLLEPDELDHAAFQALVRRWRARTLAECAASPIRWSRTATQDFPYTATRAGHRLALRVNDHPAGPPLTLFVGEEPIADLDAWPEAWRREGVTAAPAASADARPAAG